MRALFFLVSLTACAPAPETDPEQAYARAEQAIRDHDAEAALALLADAARQDHVPSLKLLLDGYDRGFWVPDEWNGTQPVRLPVDARPGQHAMTVLRLRRAVSRGARAGNPDALLEVAHTRLLKYALSRDDGDPHASVQVLLDSARVAYRRADDAGADGLRLAMLARTLGDDPSYRRHLAAAAADGDPTACMLQVWFHEDDPQTTTSHMAGVARYFDRIDACAPDRPLPAEALRPLRDLRAQLDLGNPAASVALDSLRQLGVFERHPEGAAVVAG